MTQIITSGATIINATADDSTVEMSGDVPTGGITRSDGSSYTIGDLHNYQSPELHKNVSLPDADPGALSYLRWDGSAVVAGPDYAAYQTMRAAASLKAAESAYMTILASGVEFTFTSAPALSGTYTVPAPSGTSANMAAQANITSIETSIAAGHGLPGGGSTFYYFDAMGNPHAFSADAWGGFAVAMMNYSYALQGWALNGFEGDAPTNQITIA